MDKIEDDINGNFEKLDKASSLKKRIKLVGKIENDIKSMETIVETNKKQLLDLDDLSTLSENIEVSDEDIEDIYNRIEKLKGKLDKEEDMVKRIELYANLKLEIEQYKAYLNKRTMDIKNLNS